MKASESPEVKVFPNRDCALDGIHEGHPSLDDACRASPAIGSGPANAIPR
jgi:hypothetical protein